MDRRFSGVMVMLCVAASFGIAAEKQPLNNDPISLKEADEFTAKLRFFGMQNEFAVDYAGALGDGRRVHGTRLSGVWILRCKSKDKINDVYVRLARSKSDDGMAVQISEAVWCCIDGVYVGLEAAAVDGVEGKSAISVLEQFAMKVREDIDAERRAIEILRTKVRQGK